MIQNDMSETFLGRFHFIVSSTVLLLERTILHVHILKQKL